MNVRNTSSRKHGGSAEDVTFFTYGASVSFHEEHGD
jgi:hypothetical protein